ncbi:MAG: hypothetical protein WD250_17060 [Egibacteraceae bacterium]
MDSAKTHQAFAVAPARQHRRPSDAVHLRDDRPSGSPPLTVDADALDAALHAAGATVGPHTEIRLRLRPQTSPGQQGSTQKVGPDAYRVVVHVAAKPALADRHLYVVNNSLVHELRHVQQHQHDPDFNAAYLHANLTVGYDANPYEVEARYYGRLADPTGHKDTGLAGPPLGKHVWGLRVP